MKNSIFVAEIITMRITIVVYYLPDAGNHASSAVSTKWVLQELQLPELCQSLLDNRGLQKCHAKSLCTIAEMSCQIIWTIAELSHAPNPYVTWGKIHYSWVWLLLGTLANLQHTGELWLPVRHVTTFFPLITQCTFSHHKPKKPYQFDAWTIHHLCQ